MRRRTMRILAAVVLLAGATAVSAGVPAETCQVGRNRASGKLAGCRHKAHAKYALSGDVTKRDAQLVKCATRYDDTWARLEATAAGAGDPCLVVDRDGVRDFIAQYTADVAAALAGGPLLGGPQGLRVRTGQTTCWSEAGASIPCAGTGQDGEIQAGMAPPFYLDLGVGTIFDTRSGLTWEKQSDDGSIHDFDNTYTWADGFAKIAALNTTRFAGYDDWRVPNVNEMHTIISYVNTSPAVPFAFHSGCTPGCSALVCACTPTGLAFYWMSDVAWPGYGNAWAVRVDDGNLFTPTVNATYRVRAVRGGF